MKEITRAAVLTPAKIRHLLNVTEATSRHKERDAAILLLGLCCEISDEAENRNMRKSCITQRKTARY